jgi:hypothetical protein
LFLLFTLKNSIGNVVDILNALDKKTWSGEELSANYQALIEKWGEWEIIGQGSAGIVVRYVDIGNALFSGLAITFATASFVSFACALVFGKIVFPLLYKHYKNSNEELVDIATLQSATQINDMANKGKDKKKEWF